MKQVLTLLLLLTVCVAALPADDVLPLSAKAVLIPARSLAPLLGKPAPPTDYIQAIASGGGSAGRPPSAYRITVAYSDPNGVNPNGEQTQSCVVGADTPVCFFLVTDASVAKLESVSVDELTPSATVQVKL